MPTYYLAGLMYVNGCAEGDGRVLIPDGSNDPEIQPPLSATILVAKEERVTDTFGSAWRPRVLMVDGKAKDFYEFILKKRSRVSLPHKGGVRCGTLERGLPRAQNADFVPDLETPDTIAEIEIGAGTLTARTLAAVPIVEWTVAPERGNVTITASVLGEDRKPTDEAQTLTVRGDATVVFVHSSDLYAEPVSSWEDWPNKDGGGGQDEDKGWGPPTADAPAPDGQKEPTGWHYRGAKLYAKIAKGRQVDAHKFANNRIAANPGPDIPDAALPNALKGMKHRPGFPDSDPTWCC